MKITNVILLAILIIVVVVIGGYFAAKTYLSSQSAEFLFMHPTIAKIFNATPVCPMICTQSGVCGKDGKNYCNQCIALQNKQSISSASNHSYGAYGTVTWPHTMTFTRTRTRPPTSSLSSSCQ